MPASMKIHRTAGPNKGRRRQAWVLIDKETGEPFWYANGLVVFPSRRAALYGFHPTGLVAVKFRSEHLDAVYRRNRR